MEHEKTCAYCNKTFTAHRSDTMYCGSTCRTYASKNGKTKVKKSRKEKFSLSGIPSVELKQAQIERPVTPKQTEKTVQQIPTVPQVEQEQELHFSMMPPLRGYVEDVAQVNLAKLPPPPDPPIPFNEQRPIEIQKEIVSYAVDIPNPEYKRLFDAKQIQLKAIEAQRKLLAQNEEYLKQLKDSTNITALQVVVACGSGAAIGNGVAEPESKGTGMVVGGLLGFVALGLYNLATRDNFLKEKAIAIEKQTKQIGIVRSYLTTYEDGLKLLNQFLSAQSELLSAKRQKVGNTDLILNREKEIKSYEKRKDEAHQRDKAYGKAVADYEAKYGSIQSAFNALENAEEMPQAEVNDSGVISSLGLNKVVGGALLFKGAWRNFFGTPSRDFKLVIHGPSFSGKSHLALKFAYYLAIHHGKVLYNTSEEGFSRTMDAKLEKLGARAQGLDIGNYTTVADLKKKIPRTSYNFIVLDSVSDMNMDAEDLQELRRFYCCSSIIGICQNTKAGDIRGGYDLVHDADIKIRVEEGIAYTDKNRFVDDRPELEIFKFQAVPNPAKSSIDKLVESEEKQIKLQSLPLEVQSSKPEKQPPIEPPEKKNTGEWNMDSEDLFGSDPNAFDHIM